ncbi:MAG TPA: glycosyltransferase, partial [Chroococcales cyanobacterium]
TDNIVENSHPLNQGFVDTYNYLLRHSQPLMKYYHWFVQTFKPNDSELGFRLVVGYINNLLDRVQPDVLVSAHPMTNQYLARTLKARGDEKKIKLITLVTDPNGELWKGWACPEAALTIVPNDLAMNRLISWGVPPERIRPLGVPVHPDFIKPASVSQEEFRHHLGLHRDRLTICINAGWAGGGNMLAIYKALEKVDRPLQVIFLCGHNRQLYEKARRMSRRSSIPTAVLPFHDRIGDLMSAVDLMVTKAGGLTTFEAVAKRLPMAFDMITEPMPQEIGTMNLLVSQGLAREIRRPRDIVKIVSELQPVADRANVKLPSAHYLDRVGAVYDITRTIMSYCDPLYQPIVEHRPATEHCL